MKLAGIVLFNPSIGRLTDNINAILPQVDKIYMVDNGSSNKNEIVTLTKLFSKVSITYNQTNKGIAHALNEIFEYAKNNSYQWVITLDQDSVVADNLIEEYEKYYLDNELVMVSCRVNDRNFTVKEKGKSIVEDVNTVITSGAFVSVKAWELIDGFDDSMFIDFVDNDFCYRFIKAGGRIRKVNSTYILHELGHSQIVHPLGMTQIIYNHSPFRCYYMIRNRIYFGRKNLNRWQYVRNLLAVILRFSLIIIYESEKKRKLKSMIQGIRDGFNMRIS